MPTVPALTLRFRTRYPAVARSVRAIRSDVAEVARDCGADGTCLEQIRLAVSEAAREAVAGALPTTFVGIDIELGHAQLVLTVCHDGQVRPGGRMLFPCVLAVDGEHDRAVERLEEALVEQDRLSDRLDAAVGTSTELAAYTRLRAAGDDVAARHAWLHWVDDWSSRGLNAGPFELRAAERAVSE